MPIPDTIDKIVTSYFAAVATEPFTYKRKTYNPKLLQVSVGVFTKRMNCVEDCGGCCNKFTLDWLPSEGVGSIYAVPRPVEINGLERAVFTDMQEGNEGHHCTFLGDRARCKIHGIHPFSCDFELLRFSHFKQPHRNNYLNHRPYGRAWNMKRQDGERGALCEWYDAGEEDNMLIWRRDTVRRLMRLRDWCRHWEIPNCVDEIIEWVKTGPHKEPLVTGKEYVNVDQMGLGLEDEAETKAAVEPDRETPQAPASGGGGLGNEEGTEPERGDDQGEDLPWGPPVAG